MEEMYINHIAVLVCAVMNLVIGAIWYSPVMFYKAWLKETGIKEESLSKINPLKLYGTTFILALIISYNLAFFLGDNKTDWKWGMQAGFLAGFAWAAMIFTIIGLFEQRTWKYILINGAYITVYFTVIGLILGIWR